jgi:Pyruvate/2-oxoacid:ferredoxin oxidoreductase delta subunit
MKWKLPLVGKPSTRAWIREARRLPSYSLFDFLHGYIYARFPYFYIGVGTGKHRLARWIAPFGARLIALLSPKKRNAAAVTPAEKIPPGALPGATPGGLQFANTYHGKVIPLNTAKQLVHIRQEIHIEDLETVIPYDRARALILNNPQHIVALDCPCRAAREKPCLPLDVCLIIGEPFAGFIAEHQPKRSRWITADEAVAILKAEDERGHVHHAFFKDAMLGRFYAICNCCECCCGAMHAHRSGTPMLTASGYRASVDQDRCLACGSCLDSCPFHALSLSENGCQHAEVDPQRCMGCGVCLSQCPVEGISLVLDPANGVPLEIP